MTENTMAVETMSVEVKLIDQIQTWLNLKSICPKTCASQKVNIVPDGSYISGLCKDYGGRYGQALPCDCGRSEIHEALCRIRNTPYKKG